jgi:hypothetical protein
MYVMYLFGLCSLSGGKSLNFLVRSDVLNWFL